MESIIPNQNSIFKSPALVMAFQNIHPPSRLFVAGTKPRFMLAASNLNGPFYVTLDLPSPHQFMQKRRKINFISTIPKRSRKQYCLAWKLAESESAFSFQGRFHQHENIVPPSGMVWPVRIPPNDWWYDDCSFNAHVIVPSPGKTCPSTFCKLLNCGEWGRGWFLLLPLPRALSSQAM